MTTTRECRFKPFTTAHKAALAELYSLGVVVEIKALRTYVRGRNTYPLRAELRALGFRWHPTQRMWSTLGRLDPDHLPRLVEAHRANERIAETRRADITYAGALGLLEMVRAS